MICCLFCLISSTLQVEDEEDEVSKAAFEEVEMNIGNRPKPGSS